MSDTHIKSGDGGAVGRRSRLRPALLLAAALSAIAAGMLAVPAMDHVARLTLTPVLALIAACALVGAWRLESETRGDSAVPLPECPDLAALVAPETPAAIPGQDTLTGLANRDTYNAWLRDHWARLAGSTYPVGLILIGVDHFALYNDYYGHAAGDVCLQTVARCLRDQSRGTTDQVARVGGAVFAIVLPGMVLDVCGDVAERLRAAVAAADLPHLGAPPARRLTVSCGAASFVASGRATEAALIAAADAAMAKARQGSGNRVCLADQPGGGRSQADGPAAEAHSV